MPFKSSFSQLITSTQFYIYGRRKFGRSGFESAAKAYPKPDLLGVDPKHTQVKYNPTLNLGGRVYIVTGANSGVGYEITKFLAMHGARVHMVCRNKAKAEKAKAKIEDECMKEIAEDEGKEEDSKKPDLRVLIADVSLESDVRRAWKDFLKDSAESVEKEEKTSSSSGPRLDGLVCNAGALLNTLHTTKEGVEVTFAAHLLFGTYLFGSLAMGALKACPTGGRLVAVSSGGMYNTKWPGIDEAASNSPKFSKKYDGQFSYACAKRGQVMLCERWGEAAEGTSVRIVSCHPGWTATPGVDKAYVLFLFFCPFLMYHITHFKNKKNSYTHIILVGMEIARSIWEICEHLGKVLRELLGCVLHPVRRLRMVHFILIVSLGRST